MITPIKTQGKKTKLIDFILNNTPSYDGVYYEPFMGSGQVGFNISNQKSVFSDVNKHIIQFYNDIKSNKINPELVRKYLELEGSNLTIKGEEHYYTIRNRFNLTPNSLDFIFLNRSCFNGLMRFNKKGWFNTPFCRKPSRFSKSYITKIVNQIKESYNKISQYKFDFVEETYYNIIPKAKENDFIYLDPPYMGRNTGYFVSWSEEDEERLYELLKNTKAKFMISNWKSYGEKENPYFKKWEIFNIKIKDHYYFVGSKEEYRNTVQEVIITNY
jgi:DNA adenine methylase